MENIKDNFVMIVIAGLMFIFAIEPLRAEPLDSTIKYMQDRTLQETEIINEYLKNTRPKIFPVITATIGGIGAAAALSGSGASVPIIVLGVAANTFTGYFYGYGIEAAIDRHIIVPAMLKDKIAQANNYYGNIEEEMERRKDIFIESYNRRERERKANQKKD